LTSAAEGRRFEILFVCLGNLCRSPMAEGMARGFIERDHGESLEAVEVSSAGLGALEGEPPTDEAVRVMAACDIDISGHRARRASPSVMASVDLVLAMEERHRERLMIMGVTAPVFVLLRLGEAAGEALKVREDTWAPSTVGGRLERLESITSSIEREGLWSMPPHEYDVPDPMGLPMEGYRAVAGRMSRPIGDILRTLLGGPPPRAR